MNDSDKSGVIPTTAIVGMVLVVILSAAPAAGVVPSSGGMLDPASTPSSPQLDGSATEVDSCTIIDDPGQYILTQNIGNDTTRTCLDIRSNDVALDGAGHAVHGGVKGDSTGVLARSVTNVSVSDLAVTNWGTNVYYDNVSDGVVRNITTARRLYGILLENTTHTVVSNDTNRNSVFAVDLEYADENTVSNNIVSGGQTGVSAYLSDDNVISDNTMSGTDEGISLSQSDDTVVSDNTARTTFTGLYLQNADNTTVSNNTIALARKPFPFVFREGLTLLQSDDNTITHTDISNADSGISLDHSENNVFEDDRVNDSREFDYGDFSSGSGNTAENLRLDSAVVSFDAKNVALSAVASPPADPANRTNIGQYVNASLYAPNSSLDLRMSYENGDLGAVNESTLELWRYNRSWSAIPESSVDADANVVSANVTDSGVLAPLGATNGQPTEPPTEPNGSTEPTKIDSCTVIDEPGRYTLTKDLENATATEDTGIATDLGNVSACIVIDSSDVVFDGAGHLIDGKGAAPPEGTTAIKQNTTLNESREIFPTGVSAVSGGENITNVTVRDVTATDWFLGALTVNVTDSTIRGTTANDNDNLGMELLGGANSSHLTAANNTANGNGFAGIYLGGTDDNTLVNNTAANNDVSGIQLFVSNHNTLADNHLDGNDVAGVAVFESSGNGLAGNVLANTRGNNSLVGYSGGLVLVNTTDTHLEDTVATGNEEWDLYALNASVTATNDTLDTATVSFDSKDVALDAAESPPADPENRTNIGQYINATNTSPDSFLDLDVNYTDDDVADAGVNESTLQLFEFDGREWTEIEGSSVDTDANVVSANVTDFSVFVPLGTQASEPSPKPPTKPGVAYYQVDFVKGDPIENLRGPNGTYTSDQLIRFAHGSTDEPVMRRSDGEFTTDHTLADRIDSEDIEVANGTATITFTVTEGDPVTLTLASYEKVGPGWSPRTEAKQTFVDSETRTFDSGTHTLNVTLPEAESRGADETGGTGGTD